MAEDISIMVLPPLGGVETAGTPQFYWYEQGVWRDLTEKRPLQMPLRDSRQSIEGRISDLMRRVGRARENDEDVPPILLSFEEFLGALYDNVVPRELQRLLNTAAAQATNLTPPTLRIHVHPQVGWIPWEIMYDGTNFLGLRFEVVRLPIVPGGPELRAAQSHPVHCIHSLLAENLLSPGTQLFREWQAMFTNLVSGDGEPVHYPTADGQQGDWPVLATLRESCGKADILHVTCHGGVRGQTLWTLNDKTQWPENHHITPDSVKRMRLGASRPLVFGNACASAGAQDPGGLSWGFGEAFLAKGALAFVGTLAPVTYHLAIDFACRFYGRLLRDRLPVGQALWETKKHYRDAQENDPSWLFYCLYGLPDTSFSLSNE